MYEFWAKPKKGFLSSKCRYVDIVPLSAKSHVPALDRPSEDDRLVYFQNDLAGVSFFAKFFLSRSDVAKRVGFSH